MSAVKHRRRGPLLALALLATTAVSVLAVQSPVQAAARPGVVLQNVGTRMCLDSNFAGEVYAIGCYQPGTNDHQMWQPAIQDSMLTLRNVATGRCLMNSSSRVTTTECGGRVPPPGIHWYATGPSWAQAKLRPVDSTGRCVGSSGPHVYAYGCNKATNQNWRFVF